MTSIEHFSDAAVTYLIRVLPLTLIRRRSKTGTSAPSLLCALCDAGGDDLSGHPGRHPTRSPAAALAAGGILAWRGKRLFAVSMVSCAVVLAVEFILC
jgi:branched-subunit amino acid transport protein